MKRTLYLLVVLGLLVSGPAWAAEFIYKYDQFSEEIVTASSQISGAPTAVQAGYAMGEAFGQLYKPNAAHYPIKIMGLDLVLAKPPNGEVTPNYAEIEIYFVDGNSANPGMDTPTFSISTSDIFNPGTGQDGIKLEGGTALRIDFDWEDVGGHPPILFEGNFLVMVRFSGPSKSLVDEWGISQCLKEFGAGLCGCQPAGTVHDGATTSGANVLNIKPGGCEFAATQWVFTESLGLTGDIVMRVRADVAGTGTCTPNCGNNQCGNDGCGGSCGNCPAGQDCVSGQCQGGTCTPNCGSNLCGNDGCGGSCGTCNPGEGCINGQCVVGTCTPNCSGKVCGDDGCGGSCGTCNNDEFCGNGQCEPVVEPCGNVTYQGCCAHNVLYFCQEQALKTLDCEGGVCGWNATEKYYDCPSDGTAEPSGVYPKYCGTCTPECGDATCGDDGCGGSCGSCNSGETCAGGQCLATSDPTKLLIHGISPNWGYSDELTFVSITGQSFDGSVGFGYVSQVLLGGTALSGMQVVGSSIITAVVPKGLNSGFYTLVVATGDGESAFLDDAFEVRVREAVCGDNVCGGDESCATCPDDCGQCPPSSGGGCATGPAGATSCVLILMALLSLAWRRRRA